MGSLFPTERFLIVLNSNIYNKGPQFSNVISHVYWNFYKTVKYFIFAALGVRINFALARNSDWDLDVVFTMADGGEQLRRTVFVKQLVR